MIDLKNIMQDKKKLMVVALVILAIIGIIIWLRRRKTQESNYVMQRGGFSGGTEAQPTPTPTPTPEPPPAMPPPPDGAPGGGDGIMGMPPPEPEPVPPPHHPGGHPSVPYPPYGYGYPGPVYYDPFPRTYIIEQPVKERSMNKGEYIDYLTKTINALEYQYDLAIDDLMLGRAIKISGQIRELRRKLREQLGY